MAIHLGFHTYTKLTQVHSIHKSIYTQTQPIIYTDTHSHTRYTVFVGKFEKNVGIWGDTV